MTTGKVKIKIIGCQTIGKEHDETVVDVEGIYTKTDDGGYIRYIEEPEEGVVIQNQILLSKNGVTIAKRGAVVSDMVFVPGECMEVAYRTPYGTLAMETRCESVNVEEGVDKCHIKVVYGLFSGGELVSDCVTEICATLI